MENGDNLVSDPNVNPKLNFNYLFLSFVNGVTSDLFREAVLNVFSHFHMHEEYDKYSYHIRTAQNVSGSNGVGVRFDKFTREFRYLPPMALSVLG